MSKIVDLTGLSRFWANVDKKKASIDGTYPDLVSGDLAGRGESVPASFGFRASGGKSIKDGRAYIKRIKGNSVVWNQKVDGGYVDGERVIYLNEGIPKGHVFCMQRTISNGACWYLPSENSYKYQLAEGESGGVFTNTLEVDATYVRLYCTAESGYVRLIDLTQMFQAGNEPTTIEEFNARVATLGVDLYAYNEGEVIHCNTESIKSVGDNAWDEEWEVGTITEVGGIDYPSDLYSRTRGYVKVIGGEQYVITSPSQKIVYLYYYDRNKNYTSHKYINTTLNGDIVTIPSNCQYMRFVFYATTYNHDICIRLAHSGYKTDYEPYWQDTLPLPIIRSKYFPQGMKSAGTAHDEIRYNKASGKWEAVQKIGSVDMGTFDWILTSQQYFRAILPSDSIAPTNTDYNGFICAKYERVDLNLIYSQQVAFPCFGIPANNPVCCVSDSSYTDAATFKAAMQGVILYYELAEPIVTELDAEDQNFRDYYKVADFGTEQSQSSVPSAAFSADIIYQFNAVDMIREHEIEINELQSIIATMQAQLASLTSNNG